MFVLISAKVQKAVPELQGRRQTHRGQLLYLDEFEKQTNKHLGFHVPLITFHITCLIWMRCLWSSFPSSPLHQGSSWGTEPIKLESFGKSPAKQIHFHSFQRCLLLFSASRLEKPTVYGKCCQSKKLTAWGEPGNSPLTTWSLPELHIKADSGWLKRERRENSRFAWLEETSPLPCLLRR